MQKFLSSHSEKKYFFAKFKLQKGEACFSEKTEKE